MRIRFARRALPVLLLMLVGVGGAVAAPTSTTVTVRSAKVSALGSVSVLVTASGLTLYHLTSEAKNSVSCTVACTATWPPLLVTGTTGLVAGSGLTSSKIGTIKRPDGRVQVTYNGFALYRFAADKKAGDAKGQALGGVWYAISPLSGKIVKTKLSATATASAGASTSGASAKGGAAGGGQMDPPYPGMGAGMSGAMSAG
jgi:predicted lipoprotein with Yx(FWY)xxD motif